VIIQSVCIETKVEAGKINTSVRELIREYIRSVPKDLTLKISLEVLRKKRSLPQNAYYWGVVVPYYKKWFEDTQGTILSAEETHNILKVAVGKMVRVVTLPNGNVYETVDTSTKLNTAQWEVYMSQCRMFASQFCDMIIPLPNEDLTLTIYN